MKKKKYVRSGLFRHSVLIFYLTKFSGWIYHAFLSGFFGWILTSYDALAQGFASSKIVRNIKRFSGMKALNFIKNAKRFIAVTYERSFFLNKIRDLSTKILTAKINTFGLFFFSYGIYLVLIQLIKKYAIVMETSVPHAIYIGFGSLIAGFFMLFSKKNVASAVYDSRILRFILFDFLGLRILDVANAAKCETRKGFNIPFLFSMIFALISIFIDPLMIIEIILLFILFSVILSSPETGIILMFLSLPFLATIHLAEFLCLILISYILKLICGRRIFRLHLLDFSVIAFLIFVFCGGVVTIDTSSFPKMLLMLCFMSAYFIVKNIISSPVLVRRCLYALVIGATVVSAYGIYQNYFEALSTTWQDVSVFSEIRGRVVSTFENPNVLGEFLILVFPITLALMANAKRANERFWLFISATLHCACLIFTWSRGAWLGFAIATVLFLCVSSKYFFTAGLLSIPAVATFFVFNLDASSSILRRITSFSDSSTSYRLNIWKGVLQMLQDIGLYGIGIGEGAFSKAYPAYALSGIEVAPHSHNLYLQITVEMGIFALLAFLCLIFTFSLCSFSFCKNAVNRANRSICLGIFCGIFAFLIQGLTDYVFYNYRIFLLFWLILGLGVAHIYTSKNTDEESMQYYY